MLCEQKLIISFITPLRPLAIGGWPSNHVTVLQEDSKLYIFLELVTQGSLASLYQKYRLRDTHVSAYTRQILNGLTYLHERNIVHR
jgi:serine/threonine protein kinase